MKIGIVTQPLSDNYGGVLQNYALQTTLKKLGHEPTTLNVVPKTMHEKIWFRHTVKYILKQCILNKKEEYYRLYYNKDKRIAQFVDKYIIHTPVHRDYTGFDVKRMGFDAIVLGSDQVWRKEYNYGVWKDKFLRFVGEENVLRLAYAASWGSDRCEFNSKDLSIARPLIWKFKAVSVREKSGIDLCKKNFGIEAIEVLDPTLLLSKDDYAELTKQVKREETPYLAAYVLDSSSQKKQLINQIAKSKGLRVIDFGLAKNNIGVEEWLSLFANADFVVTDSFHGTVFSIINHRPFASVVNAQRGATRFYSLLSKFGLENRIVETMDQAGQLNNIDWINVEKQLTSWQEISLNFLQSNLIK